MSDTGTPSTTSLKSSKTSSSPSSPSGVISGTASSTLQSSMGPTPTMLPTGLPGQGGGTGPANGPNGNGNSQNDPNNIQSSATLYLYTFLATLILLLGVSAAIVMRSLILRRRHRRMIEEAIRNGTWVPPSARSGPKIDPTKKPKMFEVYLGVPPAPTEDGYGEKERTAWDLIMPFAVSTIPSTTVATNSSDSSSTISQSSPTLASRLRPVTRPIIKTVQLIGRPAVAAWRTINVSPYVPPPRSPTESLSHLPLSTLREHAAEAAASLSQSRSQTNLNSAGDTKSSPLGNSDEFSAPLNISVLIAMPSPTPIAKLITQAQALGDDEAELPYLEVGVATGVNVGDGTGSGSDSGVESGKGKESGESRRSPLALMEEGSSSTPSTS